MSATRAVQDRFQVITGVNAIYAHSVPLGQMGGHVRSVMPDIRAMVIVQIVSHVPMDSTGEVMTFSVKVAAQAANPILIGPTVCH